MHEDFERLSDPATERCVAAERRQAKQGIERRADLEVSAAPGGSHRGFILRRRLRLQERGAQFVDQRRCARRIRQDALDDARKIRNTRAAEKSHAVFEVRVRARLETAVGGQCRADRRWVVGAGLLRKLEDLPPGEHARRGDHVGLAIRPAAQREELHELARVVFIRRVDV